MNWLMGAIGLALAGAPFLLGLNENLIAVGISLLLGGTVVLVAGVRAVSRPATWWDYWLACLLGLLIAGAPFELGLGLDPKALALTVALGISVTLLAGYQLLSLRRQDE